MPRQPGDTRRSGLPPPRGPWPAPARPATQLSFPRPPEAWRLGTRTRARRELGRTARAPGSAGFAGEVPMLPHPDAPAPRGRRCLFTGTGTRCAPSAGVWSRMAPRAACTERGDWVLPPRPIPPQCVQPAVKPLKAPFRHHRPQFPCLTMEVSGSRLWLGCVLPKSGAMQGPRCPRRRPRPRSLPHRHAHWPAVSRALLSFRPLRKPSPNARDSGLSRHRQHVRTQESKPGPSGIRTPQPRAQAAAPRASAQHRTLRQPGS